MREARIALLFLFAFAPSVAFADSCPDGRSPILVLGSAHFDNPGQDAVNVDADDVRSERRQRELAQLLDRLAAFRPTLVAIEAPFRDDKWPRRYAEWRAGSYELGRNEIEQIGFRLAGRFGLDTVTPVDYPMWMNGWTPAERGDPPTHPTESAETEKTPPERREPSPEEIAATRHFRETSLLDLFRELHDPTKIAADASWYLNLLLPPDGQGIYERTDLFTNWYKRNLRILTNLNRVTKMGEDRVLLLIGSGHLHILDDLIGSAPYYCRVDPLEVLGRAGS